MLAGMTLALTGCISLILPAPPDRPDLAILHQLWICGTAAAMMAQSGALTRVFVASGGVSLGINTALLALGGALVLALTLMPVLCAMLLGGRVADRDTVGGAPGFRRYSAEHQFGRSNETFGSEPGVDTFCIGGQSGTC